MFDITAETKKVREDMEKQGYVLTEEEYQIILEYTMCDATSHEGKCPGDGVHS